MKTINDYLYEDLLISDIVVLSGSKQYGRTTNALENGRLCHGLLYIWEGEATFYIKKGKELKVSNGQLVYIPKLLKYKMQYTKDNTKVVVVNFNLFTRNMEEVLLFRDISLVCSNSSEHFISNIMAEFETCGVAQNIAGGFRRKVLMYHLLCEMYNGQEFIYEELRYPQIAKGITLLKQTYLEDIPIDFFAKQSNVSISTFRQLFHKNFGMSPVQYRNKLRINRAKQLLQNGDSTVSEAAYASGFKNLGYFCRYYKKITGETPKQKRTKTNTLM